MSKKDCTTPHINADKVTRLLYSRKEAARQVSLSIRSIDYYLAQGEFQTRRIGKKVLITHASLVKFAQGNHFGPVQYLHECAADLKSADLYRSWGFKSPSGHQITRYKVIKINKLMREPTTSLSPRLRALLTPEIL